jgi:hypothetical protein
VLPFGLLASRAEIEVLALQHVRVCKSLRTRKLLSPKLKRGALGGQSAVQAVALQGALPDYQLKKADVTCSSMGDLSVNNIRWGLGAP